MSQQLRVSSSTIGTTKRYSFAWCNGGEDKWWRGQMVRTIPPYLPYGTITSASIFTTPLESSNESAAAAAASVIKCQCLHHWFLIVHINGDCPYHNHGVMHVILEKDQEGIHISYNEDLETLIHQREQDSPDHKIHKKTKVLIERWELYGKKKNTHDMIEFLEKTITEDRYQVCSANCQHFVEDLLKSIGLFRHNPCRIRSCCFTD